MEKKDYYTLREIILGLRPEYLLYRREMDKLKQYAECNDKRVKDYQFYIIKQIGEKALDVGVEFNTTNLQKMYNKLFRDSIRLYGLYNPTKDTDIDSKIYKIGITDKDSFDNLLKKIFNMDINNRIGHLNHNENRILELNNNYIHFCNYSSSYPLQSLFYIPNKDIIKISNRGEYQNYTLDQLLDVLNRKIYICLNDYNSEAIDKNMLNAPEINIVESHKNNKELILSFR